MNVVSLGSYFLTKHDFNLKTLFNPNLKKAYKPAQNKLTGQVSTLTGRLQNAFLDNFWAGPEISSLAELE